MADQMAKVSDQQDKTHLKDDPPNPPLARHPTGTSTQIQPLQSTAPSRESLTLLHQQRQKNEIRRLLKHTCPEVKSLDGLVEEELADALSSETIAADTGYLGEVQSRRLLFENVPRNTVERDLGEACTTKGNVKRNSSLFELPQAGSEQEGSKEPAHTVMRTSENNRQSAPLQPQEATPAVSSEDIRQKENFATDVKATRNIFETKPVDALKHSHDDMCPVRAVVSGDVKGTGHKQTKAFEERDRNITDTMKISEEPNKNSATDIEQDTGEVYMGISHAREAFERKSCEQTFVSKEKRMKEVRQRGSFPESIQPSGSSGSTASEESNKQDSENFGKRPEGNKWRHEVSDSGLSANDNVQIQESTTKANVKHRAQLFESTPFENINRQTTEASDTMVEKTNKTLTSLCSFDVIHSHGTIVEADEIGKIKRARYRFDHSCDPEILHEEMVTGSMKNIMLQLLPRANLKPFIKFLKEDEQGNVEIKEVDVPIQQLPFTANQDKKYRTANVVEIIEDLLGQDRSERKGVLIQEMDEGSAEVMVYALFSHNESMSENNQQQERRVEHHFLHSSPRDGDVQKGTSGDMEIVINRKSTQHQDNIPSSSELEENKTVNVKLIQSCIEKGDLDHLKRLQKTPSEEDLKDLHEKTENLEQNVLEISPGNVKNIKTLFTSNQSTSSHDSVEPQVATKLNVSTYSDTNRQPDKFNHQCLDEGDVTGAGKILHSNDAEPVCRESLDDMGVVKAELVDVVEDDEMSCLHAAILSLHQATVQAKAVQQNVPEKQLCSEQSKQPMATQSSEEHDSPAVLKDKCLEEVTEPSQNTVTEPQQEGKEEIVKGNIQAALDSLQKSSFNVTKGDFRAAMIYRNSGKVRTSSKKKTDEGTVSKLSNEIVSKVDSPPSSPLTETEQVLPKALDDITETFSNQSQSKNIAAVHNAMANQTQNAAHTHFKKDGKPTGPKPAIPPKPDHLKVKPGSNKAATPVCLSVTEIKGESQIMPLITISPTDQKNVSNEAPQLRPKSYKDALCKGLYHSGDKKESKQIDSSNICNNVANSVVDRTAEEGNNNPEEIKPLTDKDKEIGDMSGFSISDKCPESNAISSAEKGAVNLVDKSPESNTEKIKTQNEVVMGFQASLQNFGAKAGGATPPVKPKRIKMAQNQSNSETQLAEVNSSCLPTGMAVQPESSAALEKASSCEAPQSSDSQKINVMNRDRADESKVIMREKKVKKETENERRQRLSVHMDQIMRGNVDAAMEIFDKIREQEELKNILSRVEEIEEDTSQVDVSSLRKIFESVPDWVVPRKKNIKPKNVTVEQRDKLEPPKQPEMLSSMELVFGDLEKASAEIIHLKEQTLARLVDIEEAIKKALCSVSTLKSDSDIAGLSGLFKESLVAAQSLPSSCSLKKISIGSSKSQKVDVQRSSETHGKDVTGLAGVQEAKAKPKLDSPMTKTRAGSPSSPSFISIQSAARRNVETPVTQSPKPKHNAVQAAQNLSCQDRTTNIRQCSESNEASYSPAVQNRQVSTLEVQTNHERQRVTGTKTISENFEKKDCFGNMFYSSKTSTVVTTQPDTRMSSQSKMVTSPTRSELVTYPKINTPSIREDQPLM